MFVKEKILQILTQAQASGGYISGEEISQELGVSRAYIWKSISALRDLGYAIEAKTNLGYRLLALPKTASKEAVLPLLCPGAQAFCQEFIYLDEVDSTNSYLKRIAASGAAHGTVCIANAQTGGRGRLGRSFVSDPGKGLFLSILLRPEQNLPLQNLTLLTAFSAVAVCRGISRTVAVSPQIKWVNDILVEEKKLVGILSEMSMVGEMGQVDYIVIGAGVNVSYQLEDFPAEIRDKATSLDLLSKGHTSRAQLAANIIEEFAHMYETCITNGQEYVAEYRARSATIGQEILVVRGSSAQPAKAVDIDQNCALIVRYPDGKEEALQYGEVSIRRRDGEYV